MSTRFVQAYQRRNDYSLVKLGVDQVVGRSILNSRCKWKRSD